VHHVNLVFIDNPVGAGYSYVDNLNDLATDVQGIGADLVSFMKLFYAKYPEFVATPVYCFSQSYGGKMAAQFGLDMDAVS
jgi:serine carboxypeptidase 1